jgi:hypothetical protein
VESVFAVPGEIADPARTARILAPVLNMAIAEVRSRLEGTGARYFSWVKRKVTASEAERIRRRRTNSSIPSGIWRRMCSVTSAWTTRASPGLS